VNPVTNSLTTRSSVLPLVPEEERAAFHLKIGRSLRDWSSSEEMNSFLFIMMDQMHRGSSCISDHEEKIGLSRLSLKAGQMACGMSAFLPAAAYLKCGIGLLVDEDWDLHRSLCFDLYNLCAETECILGDFDDMKIHLEDALKRAHTLQERLRPNLTLVQSLGSQGCVIDAINTGLSVMIQLGEPFPHILTETSTKKDIMMTQSLLRTKSEEELVQLQVMVDGEKQQTMKFLHILTLYIFAEHPKYFSNDSLPYGTPVTVAWHL